VRTRAIPERHSGVLMTRHYTAAFTFTLPLEPATHHIKGSQQDRMAHDSLFYAKVTLYHTTTLPGLFATGTKLPIGFAPEDFALHTTTESQK